MGRMMIFLKKLSTLFAFRKNRNKRKADVFPGRENQPVFTSRSAAFDKKKPGLLQRLLSWKHRPRSAGSRDQIRRENKQGGLARVLIPVTVLGVFACLAYAAYPLVLNAVSGMSLFKIRDVAVSGCRVTTPTMIRELAGIRYQASMLSVDIHKAEAVLRIHPWIAEAHVSRKWPDGLAVSIREFTPDALIVSESSGTRQLYYLDRHGSAFAPVEPGQDVDLPVVTGLEALREGKDRTALLQDALLFLKYVRQNNPNLPAQNLSEIHVDQEAGMTVYLADYPFPIYFGSGEIRTKYSRLKRVLEALYKETEQGKTMADIAFIRMDYQENKVLVVAHSGPG